MDPSIVIDNPEQQLEATPAANGRLRTVVYVDYQNMFYSAREAYGWQNHPMHYGHFRPYGLGRQMCRDGTRSLSNVRVYTGMHTPQRKPEQHSMMQRRMSAWVAENPDVVEVFPSALKYRKTGPQEKGVDVELAIHLVAGALDDAFDVAVLASADTDLVPALRLVAERFPEKQIVTLGCAAVDDCVVQPPQPLDLSGHKVERRFITKRDFDRIADRVNFFESASDKSTHLDQARWKKIVNRSK